MLCLDLYIDFVSFLPVFGRPWLLLLLDSADSLDEARSSWKVGASHEGTVAQRRVFSV